MVRLGGTLVISFLGMLSVGLFFTDWSILTAPKEADQERVISSSSSTSISNHDTSSNKLPKNSTLFPKRIISVFGLEKSGTTWTSLTIAKALGVLSPTRRHFGLSFNAYSSDRTIQVQHISQPWGFFPNQPVTWVCKPQNAKNTRTIFAAVPLACANHSNLALRGWNDTLPQLCKEEAQLDEFVQMSSRFFVNITSHIQWYLERGVDATAVILMRDNTIAQISKTRSICTNSNISKMQNAYANKITQDAIENLPPSRLVLVSFEGLVSLKIPYLKSIYKQLGMENATYMPDFKDANAKYIRNG